MAVKAIDLFSGCGGVSCGLTRAGFEVRAAVEIEPTAVQTYLNYPPLANVQVIQDDICNVTGAELLRKAGIRRNELYLLAGCPPCQNFSMQNPKNRNKPESERKKLLFEYLRIIEEIHPPFILMENVPGIDTEFNANILNEFLSRLRNEQGQPTEKYHVVKAVLNSANYGVPQQRKRFVLHGVRMDIYDNLQRYGITFGLPAPTHDKSGKKNLPLWVTVKDAIDDLPQINAGESYIGQLPIYNHKCAALSDENLAKIRYIRANGGSRDCLPDSMVLACHKKKNDNGETFKGHNDVYGIMDATKPAPTMTGGCLCYSKGRYGHYSQDRALSIREAARIQTFPDDFIFSDSLTQSALQIGNAVPVRLVEASGKTFIDVIDKLRKAKRGKAKKK